MKLKSLEIINCLLMIFNPLLQMIYIKKFSTEEINNIVKDIYLSDIVFDYSLVFQDDVAFIEIEESSLIENIFINNNSFIEDDVIISQLKSKESTFLNKEFIKSDIDRIRKLYSFKGFSNALITSSVKNIPKIELI